MAANKQQTSSLLTLKSKLTNKVSSTMVFAKATLSFMFFTAVFAVVSVVASVFILPLLALSFVFSGFVVIFNGLSYSTFKLASAKYNRTVLFLNRLLRKLADSIPPSVGFKEVQPSKLDSITLLPALQIKSSLASASQYFNKFFNSGEPLGEINVGKEQNKKVNATNFEINHVPPNPIVIVDDEDSVLDHYLVDKSTEFETPAGQREIEIGSPPGEPADHDQPIKSSELNQSD